jgi:hypothetical protein
MSVFGKPALQIGVFNARGAAGMQRERHSE